MPQKACTQHRQDISRGPGPVLPLPPILHTQAQCTNTYCAHKHTNARRQSGELHGRGRNDTMTIGRHALAGHITRSWARPAASANPAHTVTICKHIMCSQAHEQAERKRGEARQEQRERRSQGRRERNKGRGVRRRGGVADQRDVGSVDDNLIEPDLIRQGAAECSGQSKHLGRLCERGVEAAHSGRGGKSPDLPVPG